VKQLLLLHPVTVVALVSLRFAGIASAQSTNSTVENQIRSVLESQQAAWNRGDIDGFMSSYDRSESTAFVSEDKITRGWQAVRDRYHLRYSDRGKMSQLTFSDLEITPLGKDSALAAGTWRLKRESDEPYGRFSLIFRLTNDGWRIVYDHTPLQPLNLFNSFSWMLSNPPLLKIATTSLG